MHVAFDATCLLRTRTGVGVFAQELLVRWAAEPDVDLAAYALSWRGRAVLGASVPPSVRVVHRPMAAQVLRPLWQRWDHPRLEAWTGPVDVVFGPNYLVPPTRHAAQVVTVHDLTCLRFPELCHGDTLQYPQMIRRAIARGAWIHAVSEVVATEIRAHFTIDPARVVAVPNGVTVPAAADPAVGHALAGAPRYVLGLGTIEPRKGFPLLVEAFDAIAADDAEVRLVIAGPDGWGLDAFDAAVAAARHRDRIVRVGWVDDDTRAALVRGATVLAFPSRYEGFGLPPLEAMAAGTAVVSSSGGALAETVGDGGLLVPPEDRDALADALRTVLGDDEHRAALIARGHDRAATFSWDRAAAGVLGLLRRASRS
jgi:glycosyltransferase involved in cell wall biosynthesis